jgi:hypothetical protein
VVQVGKIDAPPFPPLGENGHIYVMSSQVRTPGSVRKQQVDNNKDDLMPTQNPHRIVGLCTSSKVYNALTELKHLEGHRSAKFLSLLAENLVRKGLLSEQEVVHMLDLVVD